jgi:SpoIID/LytB domain protein
MNQVRSVGAVGAAGAVGAVGAVPVPVGSPTTLDPQAPPNPPVSTPDATQPPSPAPTVPPVTKALVRNLVITGHGYGHGRGLGQWGAFGYAVDKGWDYRKILGHFYGNTSVGKLSPETIISVRLLNQDNKPVAIYQSTGQLFLTINGETVGPDASAATATPVSSTPAQTVPVGPVAVGQPAATIPPSGGSGGTTIPGATTIPAVTTVPSILPPSGLAAGAPAVVRIQLVSTGRFAISEASSCAGPWVSRGTVSTSAVIVSTRSAADKAAVGNTGTEKNDPATMLQVCTSNSRRTYRGDLAAVDGKPGQFLVNQANMEDYLRGVVPSEVPAGWGAKPNGMEALKAQAVAARSYAAAEKRPGYASTCDTTACQVYAGRGEYRNGVFVSFEDTRTDEAVKSTVGEIRSDKAGAVVRTEFSSSTGGQSAPGAFPPVVDEGDKTSANPHATWTVTLTAARLEAGRKLGAFKDIEITLRDGVGPYGGRVQNLNLVFERGKVSLKSGEFLRAYNLQSVLFNTQIVEVGGGVVGGTLPPLDTIPDDGTTGLANPNQNQTIDAPAPETTPPVTKKTGGKSAPTSKGSGAKPTKPKSTGAGAPVAVGKKPQVTLPSDTPPSTVKTSLPTTKKKKK